MKINEKKLLEKLNKKWKGNNCPYCQMAEWSVDTTIVTPIEVGEKKEMKISKIILMIYLIMKMRKE